MTIEQVLSDIDRAYLAGIVDGEGTIGTSIRLQIRVVISMTDQRVIEWIAGRTGRTVRCQIRPGVRPLYDVGWVSQQAAAVLRQLLPYLKVKDKQAVLAIRLAELKAVNLHTGGIPILNRDAQQSCADQIRRLKREDFEIEVPEVGPAVDRPVRHGTRRGYQQGCRCLLCRAANADAQRAWRRQAAPTPPSDTPCSPSV